MTALADSRPGPAVRQRGIGPFGTAARLLVGLGLPGRLAAHRGGRLVPVRSFHAEARRLVEWLEAAPTATRPSA